MVEAPAVEAEVAVEDEAAGLVEDVEEGVKNSTLALTRPFSTFNGIHRAQ